MKDSEKKFKEEYSKLNKAQKEAVDAIDGPVMVVAGPGTGKTQILALRIANILTKTDNKADSILSLTFTNSGVKAMRERLREYIGVEASKIHVSTFHSFGMEIIEKYFRVLDLEEMPKLMDEMDSVAIYDAILEDNEWEYIRPRSDASRYFNDLNNLISLLKRERIDPEAFENLIKEEIDSLESDPENISSRGATKGELKKDVQKKIEGLARTREAVKFYEFYEEVKKEKNFIDYDDIFPYLVKIIENSEEASFDLKEKYQYILIDEHQDSSGVQNEFLEKVWKSEEKPNIFVVGDDRQLIYGFSGASLSYFENFKHVFGKAKLITLEENYRSTENILNASHSLLQSSITDGKLKSSHKENYPLRLVEASYSRDEIIACALEIKDKISAKNSEKKVDLDEIAILVPKNKQAREAVAILRDMGIPVAGGEKLNFFDSEEAQAFLQVLKIIANPADEIVLSESFFNKFSGVLPLEAHKFAKENHMREFSILNTVSETPTLFQDESSVKIWLAKLKSWIQKSSDLSLYSLLQNIGSEFLLDTAKNHEDLMVRIEVVRTLLHLVLAQMEKNPKMTLKEFLTFVNRLESYGKHIPLAVFSADVGVKVLTLHGSKGLEFDYVWIAHMDEKSLSGGRHGGFTLPKTLEEKVEKKDEEVLKRQLYVAITRAKRFCTLSYSLHSYGGGDLELANIVSDLGEHFEKQNAEETEKIILKNDPRAYVGKKQTENKNVTLADLQKLVAKDYEDRKVSVSLLNNFFECPWKWYFRNLLQLPEAKSVSLEFGNKVHSSIDKILKLKKIPKEKDLDEITGGDKEVLKIVSRWIKNRLGEIEQKRENERSVSVSDDRFPHLNVYGKIDLIENLNDKSVRVTDFKTGSVRKKVDIEKIDEHGRMSSYMRQLSMYSYLLKQSPKWKADVSESRLEFLEAKNEKESIYSTLIKKEQIDLLIKDIKDYDESAKKGEWVDRPCNYNSYGKNTECEYCKMAEIYTGPLSNQPK
ncbi:MAG: ATP-dependent DNA helicase [Candidatus Nomurabacteria bacterium]|nr:ATP-dependent DNA helicase [Candidatus Nomurabacteria bacterium]